MAKPYSMDLRERVAMVDDFGYSNRALLSRDPVSLHGF